MITRRAVSSPEAQADIATYAEGVRLMKDLPRANPLSWFYQSRMHGKPRGDRSREWSRDFDQCQHGTWWFLPWHRMYLRQLEKIVAHLTQTPAFALPYWDYRDASVAQSPPAFLEPTSPLFDEGRTFGRVDRYPDSWIRATTFELLAGTRARSHLHRGPVAGFLEQHPHNTMHRRVGGDMADFQSPLDPLFWIHHCNIDRLWEIWRRRPGRANPDADDWTTSSFEFPDPVEGRKTWRVGDVSTPEQAGYEYDDLRWRVRRRDLVSRLAPVQGPRDDEGGDSDWLDEEVDLAEEPLPPLTDHGLELMGADSSGRSVRDSVAVVTEGRLRRAAPADGLHALRRREPETETLLLRLENVGIDAGDASDTWNVYVAVDDGERHLVGAIVPFGLADLTEAGGRQTLTFDISDLADALADGPEGRLRVTFEPVDDDVTHEPFWERAAIYRAGG